MSARVPPSFHYPPAPATSAGMCPGFVPQPAPEAVLQFEQSSHSKWFWVFVVVAVAGFAGMVWFAYRAYERIKAAAVPNDNASPTQEPTPEKSTEFLTVFWKDDDGLRQMLRQNQDDVFAVMVFHPNCGFCRSMKTNFEEFAKEVRGVTPVKILPAEFNELPGIFAGIDPTVFHGVPAVFLYTRRGDKPAYRIYSQGEDYVSATLPFRSKQSLLEFAKLKDALQAEQSPSQNDATTREPTPPQEPQPQSAPKPVPEPRPAPAPEPAPKSEAAAASEESTHTPEFIPTNTFEGAKDGYHFKQGDQGVGYYKER